MTEDEARTETGRALLARFEMGGTQPYPTAADIRAIEAEAYDRGRLDAHAEYEPSAADQVAAAAVRLAQADNRRAHGDTE